MYENMYKKLEIPIGIYIFYKDDSIYNFIVNINTLDICSSNYQSVKNNYCVGIQPIGNRILNDIKLF